LTGHHFPAWVSSTAKLNQHSSFHLSKTFVLRFSLFFWRTKFFTDSFLQPPFTRTFHFSSKLLETYKKLKGAAVDGAEMSFSQSDFPSAVLSHFLLNL